jgi:hypothetical protein
MTFDIADNIQANPLWLAMVRKANALLQRGLEHQPFSAVWKVEVPITDLRPRMKVTIMSTSPKSADILFADFEDRHVLANRLQELIARAVLSEP